jgi:hypothetical protein
MPPGRRPRPPPERPAPPPLDRHNNGGRGGGGGESSDHNDLNARDRRRCVVHLAVGAGGRRRHQRHNGRQRGRRHGCGGERARLLGGRAQPILGGAFPQEDNIGEDDGDE